MPNSIKNLHTPSLQLSIDRIESGIAVLISDPAEAVTLNIPLRYLPAGAQAGDALTLAFSIDKESTAATRQRVTELQAELQKNSDADQTNIKL